MVIAIDEGSGSTQQNSLILDSLDEASRIHVVTGLKSGPSEQLGNCSTEAWVDALKKSWMKILQALNIIRVYSEKCWWDKVSRTMALPKEKNPRGGTLAGGHRGMSRR